jgi:hypothetical protein
MCWTADLVPLATSAPLAPLPEIRAQQELTIINLTLLSNALPVPPVMLALKGRFILRHVTKALTQEPEPLFALIVRLGTTALTRRPLRNECWLIKFVPLDSSAQ